MHTTWHLHSAPVCFRLSYACILEFAFVNLERFMNLDPPTQIPEPSNSGRSSVKAGGCPSALTMKIQYLILLPFVQLLAAAAPSQSASLPLCPTHLRCEAAEDPKGIDVAQPRLSWVLESGRRAERQTAYQIRVASSAKALSQGCGRLVG